MCQGLKINLFHVSGRRMQAQGPDELSQGCHYEDVLGKFLFNDYIPLHFNAFEREPRIESLLRKSLKGTKARFLKPYH